MFEGDHPADEEILEYVDSGNAFTCLESSVYSSREKINLWESCDKMGFTD